jgi:CRISPR-associated protein Cas4
MNEADPVPLAALQHWTYCPRQCGLIHLEQAFEDNIHTARGQAVHHLVDTPGYEMKAGVKVERALPLWSDRLGLIGKADLVEFHPDGTVFPVEFKHGAKRQKMHDDIQLAAQAMCLEDMLGRPVPKRRDLSRQQPPAARGGHHPGVARIGDGNRRGHPRHAGLGQAAAAGERRALPGVFVEGYLPAGSAEREGPAGASGRRALCGG